MIPFPTPFDENERVAASGLRANIEKWNETGVSGYVALGSTGERVHLDERECLEVIETARASVPESMAFIVGAGQQSTHATINETRRYARAGADAALVITPNFYRAAMTQGALINHYLAVADASPGPLVLYSKPDLPGIALAPETVARLASHENIIGLKDSSGDLINLAETLRQAPKDFAVLTGNGGLLSAALGAGARGAILAVGCVAFEQCLKIYHAFEMIHHSSYELAHIFQRKLTPLARAVTVRHGIGGLKAALELRGYAGGHVRSPLQNANDEARHEIARLLEDSLSKMPAELGNDDYALTGVTTT